MLQNLDGEAVTLDGKTLHGVTACNMPIGEEGFVKSYLDQKKNKITRRFDKITTLLDPGRWPHPEISSRKMLWVLTVI